MPLETPDEVVSAIAGMPEFSKGIMMDLLLQSMSPEAALSFRDKIIANEYINTLSKVAAERAGNVGAGCVNATLKKPAVKEYLEKYIAQVERYTNLKQEYIREYLYDVLEFCPTDWFQPGEDGHWYLAPDLMNNLPRQVKRMVQQISLVKMRGGGTSLQIQLVPKTQALALACRYLMTQKVEIVPTRQVDWDALADNSPDPVKLRIAAESKSA